MANLDEERKLQELCGRENPFRVPDGYFDTLPEHILNRVAQQKRHNRRRIIWRWAAAAVLVGCVATGGFMLTRSSSTQIATVSETQQEDFIDQALDYSMVDNQEIASFLTEAE